MNVKLFMLILSYILGIFLITAGVCWIITLFSNIIITFGQVFLIYTFVLLFLGMGMIFLQIK